MPIVGSTELKPLVEAYQRLHAAAGAGRRPGDSIDECHRDFVALALWGTVLMLPLLGGDDARRPRRVVVRRLRKVAARRRRGSCGGGSASWF